MKKIFLPLSAIIIFSGCSLKEEIAPIKEKISTQISTQIVKEVLPSKSKSDFQNPPITISASPQYNPFTPISTLPKLSPQDVKIAENGCKAGDNNACAMAAIAYYYGNGVKQDINKALYFAKRGCELGNGKLCEKLGDEYKKGIILPKDIKNSKIYYQKACKLGNQSACEKL